MVSTPCLIKLNSESKFFLSVYVRRLLHILCKNICVVQYVCNLDTTFFMKNATTFEALVQLCSFFFQTTDLTFLHGLKLIAKNLMHKARRRCVFSSIHMNFFLSNNLKFSGLFSSLIFISYSCYNKYITLL